MPSLKWYGKKNKERFLKFDEDCNTLCIVDEQGEELWYLCKFEQNKITNFYELHVFPHVFEDDAAEVGIATDEDGRMRVRLVEN
jgi:hypothetical protein